MKDFNIDTKESGKNIDIKVGHESKNNINQKVNKDYFEEKMLDMMKKQTNHISQIKNILTYFFCLSIILIVIYLL